MKCIKIFLIFILNFFILSNTNFLVIASNNVNNFGFGLSARPTFIFKDDSDRYISIPSFEVIDQNTIDDKYNIGVDTISCNVELLSQDISLFLTIFAKTEESLRAKLETFPNYTASIEQILSVLSYTEKTSPLQLSLLSKSTFSDIKLKFRGSISGYEYDKDYFPFLVKKRFVHSFDQNVDLNSSFASLTSDGISFSFSWDIKDFDKWDFFGNWKTEEEKKAELKSAEPNFSLSFTLHNVSYDNILVQYVPNFLSPDGKIGVSDHLLLLLDSSTIQEQKFYLDDFRFSLASETSFDEINHRFSIPTTTHKFSFKKPYTFQNLVYYPLSSTEVPSITDISLKVNKYNFNDQGILVPNENFSAWDIFNHKSLSPLEIGRLLSANYQSSSIKPFLNYSGSINMKTNYYGDIFSREGFVDPEFSCSFDGDGQCVGVLINLKAWKTHDTWTENGVSYFYEDHTKYIDISWWYMVGIKNKINISRTRIFISLC